MPLPPDQIATLVLALGSELMALLGVLVLVVVVRQVLSRRLAPAARPRLEDAWDAAPNAGPRRRRARVLAWVPSQKSGTRGRRPAPGSQL